MLDPAMLDGASLGELSPEQFVERLGAIMESLGEGDEHRATVLTFELIADTQVPRSEVLRSTFGSIASFSEREDRQTVRDKLSACLDDADLSHGARQVAEWQLHAIDTFELAITDQVVAAA